MDGDIKAKQLVQFLKAKVRNSDQTENILQAIFLKVKSKVMEFTNSAMPLFMSENSKITLCRGSEFSNFRMATVLKVNL